MKRKGVLLSLSSTRGESARSSSPTAMHLLRFYQSVRQRPDKIERPACQCSRQPERIKEIRKIASGHRSRKTNNNQLHKEEEEETHLSRRVRREHHPNPDEVILGQHIVDLGSDQPVQAESQLYCVARGKYACTKTGDASHRHSSLEQGTQGRHGCS